MFKLLFIPGAIFLLVIFFRVLIPYISTAPWKRIIDSALYYRSKKEFDKSDALLDKAITKYPKQPEVYLDYFLNYSHSENLKKRFEVLYDGYKITNDVILGFFLASIYLEHGMLSESEKLLNSEECRKYMLKRSITLLPQLYYEKHEYKKAEEEFESFYKELHEHEGNFTELLNELSPRDLLMLALIKKEAGEDYEEIMKNAPKSSIYSDMSWQDLLYSLEEELKNLKPAEVAINGNPGEFNRRRREYFKKRIELIQSHL